MTPFQPKSRLARYLWQFKPTSAGKFFVLALALGCGMGSATLQIPLYHFATAMSALLALALLAGILLRPRLRLEGELPARASAGHPVTARLTLVNRSRRSVYDVGAAAFQLPPEIQTIAGDILTAELKPGESAPVSIQLQPLRRGLYSIPRVTPYTTFPFDLFRIAGGPARSSSLLALPSFHALDGVDLPVGTRYQPGGVALTSSIGLSPEYIGNREYRPGDSLRKIDFRSWARLGKPVVKEYQEEFYCRVAIVLDTFIPGKKKPPAAGFPQLEAAVSLTAAAADALSRGEYLIDLFAAGPNLYVFRLGRHTAHFENLMEILACVDACRGNPFETITPKISEALRSISSMVCIFLDWDDEREGLVRAAVEAGCQVKIVVVREGATTKPLGGAEEWAASVRLFTPAEAAGGGIGIL